MTKRPAVTVPGWDVVVDDGLYVATRCGSLTEYQRSYGALSEIAVRDSGELWLICDAQTRLAERLATAEASRPRVAYLMGLAGEQASDA
jgi:hypothetical protein